MRFYTVIVFFALSWLVLPLNAGAQAGDKITPVAEVLSQQLQAFESVSGHFQQTLVDQKNRVLQTSSGQFTVQQPGYFRWDTQQPFEQLLVSDLESIWLYDPDLEQVTLRPYTRRIDQSPALLLSGDAAMIARYYRVQFAENGVDKNAEDKHFILLPKNTDSPFTQISLHFNKQLLVRMVLRDSLQQTTTFAFSDIRTDQSFPPASFTFVPPPGIDVLIDE